MLKQGTAGNVWTEIDIHCSVDPHSHLLAIWCHPCWQMSARRRQTASTDVYSLKAYGDLFCNCSLASL